MAYKPPQQHGLLVLNKPKGPSSTRCLEKIKRGLGQKKIGHAGTLDPMATGVLLVMLGKGTKIAQYLLEGGKTYSGRLKLGMATDTYDMEGEVTLESDISGVDQADVVEEILAWRALTSQIVPPYSAAKHQGKPLYKLTREGKTPPVKTKSVRISRAEVLDVDLPWVDFRVECGAGTYIRSLVHSLGMRLSCGATLCELTREHSHPFSLDQAHELDQLLDDPEGFAEKVLPLDKALPHWPGLTLSAEQAKLVKNGAQLEYGPSIALGKTFAQGLKAMFLAPDGAPLALVETQEKDGIPVWSILRGLWQN
ncbi:MAG: tRNA pseudouridine(55) synthase TruB [Desulfovibrio sp.]|nr:MAG: tRNA pseudouridine(55) synthase TruB [Desulfovibrio sp.]